MPQQTEYFEIFALLTVSKSCETELREFFCSWGVPEESVQSDMHLTVYHGQRPKPLSNQDRRTRHLHIQLNVSETRFMLLVPGGESKQSNRMPANEPVGIRLTRRNIAIEEIQNLRSEMIAIESMEGMSGRGRSSRWKNAFGSKHFQPHIKLLRPGNGLDEDLTKLATVFRSEFTTLDFDTLKINQRRPKSFRIR